MDLLESTAPAFGLDERARSQPRPRARWATAALIAERTRLEGLLAEERSWAYPYWERRYLRHPLGDALATRLLWQCQVDGTWVTGLPSDQPGLTDIQGAPLPTSPATRVRLFHPLQADPAELARWRRLLPEERFQQPFPQLFRRVYVATPAEGARSSFCDRLAGYLLPWTEAVSWLLVHGWRTGRAGRSGPPRIGQFERELEGVGIHAELFLTPHRPQLGPGALYAPTVRFRRLEDNRRWRLVDLLDVPRLVFSEVLYDLGLLVEARAVGLVRFAEEVLAAPLPSPVAAALRSDMLARAVAALGIADRCEFSDDFLRVRGDLRTYRIDLGSGEAVMEPEGRLLCLVRAPRSARTSRFPLLLEQDRLLSLIVSKAALLAEDAAIDDISIIRQLG